MYPRFPKTAFFEMLKIKLIFKILDVEKDTMWSTKIVDVVRKLPKTAMVNICSYIIWSQCVSVTIQCVLYGVQCFQSIIPRYFIVLVSLYHYVQNRLSDHIFLILPHQRSTLHLPPPHDLFVFDLLPFWSLYWQTMYARCFSML